MLQKWLKFPAIRFWPKRLTQYLQLKLTSLFPVSPFFLFFLGKKSLALNPSNWEGQDLLKKHQTEENSLSFWLLTEKVIIKAQRS